MDNAFLYYSCVHRCALVVSWIVCLLFGLAQIQRLFSGDTSMADAAGGEEAEPAASPEPEPKRRSRNTQHQMKVSLSELYTGATRKLAVSRLVVCGECSGEGIRAGRDALLCEECRGDGVVTMAHFGMRMQQTCTACAGAGKMMENRDKCKRCKGGCMVRARELVQVEITPGMCDRQKLNFAGLADEELGSAQLPARTPADACRLAALAYRHACSRWRRPISETSHTRTPPPPPHVTWSLRSAGRMRPEISS